MLPLGACLLDACIPACLLRPRRLRPPRFDNEPAVVLPAIEREDRRGRALIQEEDAVEPAPTATFGGAAPGAAAPSAVASTTTAALGEAQLQADAALTEYKTVGATSCTSTMSLVACVATMVRPSSSESDTTTVGTTGTSSESEDSTLVVQDCTTSSWIWQQP